MIYVVYISSAVKQFSPPELAELLAKSRVNNARSGLTGMLLYKDGNFMQVLEGEAAAVGALEAKIAADPRHRGMITLLRGELLTRDFSDWSMALRDLNSAEVRAQPGFSEFLNVPLTSAAFVGNPSRAQKLLLSFKKSM